MFKLTRSRAKTATPKPANPKAATPKAVTPKTTAPAASEVYRKPKADVYTVLLVVALLMIVLATVSLWVTMKDNDYMIKGGPPMPVWNRPTAGTMLDARGGIA